MAETKYTGSKTPRKITLLKSNAFALGYDGGIPYTVIVSDGKIQHVHLGVHPTQSEPKIKQQINELLEEAEGQ